MYLSSRPVVEQNPVVFYRPVPSQNSNPRTVPSRPVVKIYPVEIYRLAPSRNGPPTVPSRPVPPTFCRHYTVPSSTPHPPKQAETVPSRPVSIVSHCDKPCLVCHQRQPSLSGISKVSLPAPRNALITRVPIRARLNTWQSLEQTKPTINKRHTQSIRRDL